MKVSFTGAFEHIDRNVGYGEASNHIINSFKQAGIECLIKSKEANIGISFIQPDKYTFGKNQYKIGYTPWESTDIFWSWENPLANVIDELWVPSEWNKEIFSKHTDKPIFVYRHGIDDSWVPRKRSIDKSRPFRFLHIGEPSFRKDAQMVVDAFISLYGDDPNYELVLKCSRMNLTQIMDKKTGQPKGSPDGQYENIKVITSYISVEDMNSLYDLCDVVVYPSWGEGFGFIPLQSMGKGIPTISTSAWAEYSKYITMPLSSRLRNSPWPETHPGMLLQPNYNELKFYMQDIVKDYEYYSSLAYKNSFLVHKDYNWEKVSRPAVERLKKIQTTHF